MKQRIIIGLVLAVIAIVGTYATAEQQSVPVTGRAQRVALSDREQQALGLQVFDQSLAEQQGNLVTSGRDFEQVQRVARRIAKVGSVDKPEFDWEVALVRSDEVNAYCLPGGKMVVYTGLLPVAKTDAGLATVLGHEVAHAVAEHGAERIFREQLTNRAVTAASGAFADDPARFQQVAVLLGGAGKVGLSLPWNREQESEADHIGLIYMARAGYDPAQALAFWQRMEQAGGSGGPEYLSTHPSHGTRIRQIRGWLPEARAERSKHSAVADDIANNR